MAKERIMDKPWFTFVYDYDRQTTKKDYKKISRWLRQCREVVHKQISQEKISDMMSNMMLYGTASIEV